MRGAGVGGLMRVVRRRADCGYGLATAIAALAACGAEGPEDWPSGRPRIDTFRYLQQEPAAPADLQFVLTFVDDDGDLRGGALDLFVQERRTSSLSLDELFEAQSPPLEGDSTGGSLEFVVSLAPDIPVGARVRVGVELVDGDGDRSNQPTVELRVVGQEDGT